MGLRLFWTTWKLPHNAWQGPKKHSRSPAVPVLSAPPAPVASVPSDVTVQIAAQVQVEDSDTVFWTVLTQDIDFGAPSRFPWLLKIYISTLLLWKPPFKVNVEANKDKKKMALSSSTAEIAAHMPFSTKIPLPRRPMSSLTPSHALRTSKGQTSILSVAVPFSNLIKSLSMIVYFRPSRLLVESCHCSTLAAWWLAFVVQKCRHGNVTGLRQIHPVDLY